MEQNGRARPGGGAREEVETIKGVLPEREQNKCMHTAPLFIPCLFCLDFFCFIVMFHIHKIYEIVADN